ncbi:MAG: GTP-binding protein [Proteobacteria bacterium]|nr:MAG: GTP-binding protein [Pseudomonadota bacterium]
MSTDNKKIIFTGPVGAGKTTAIRVISDIDIVTTDEQASDMAKLKKPETTVAMDYGMIQLGENERVHLYGTPGQERFDFMWDILTKGGIGLVLLIDNSRKDPQQDLRFYTQAFREFIAAQQLVVGVTRMDTHRTPTVNDYRHWLDQLKIRAPVFEVDARKRKDVSLLIQAMLMSLTPGAEML